MGQLERELRRLGQTIEVAHLPARPGLGLSVQEQACGAACVHGAPIGGGSLGPGVAEDVDDWVVLHGGATAVFPVPSLGDAARLADAVAQVPGIEDAGVLITITDDQGVSYVYRVQWVK